MKENSDGIAGIKMKYDKYGNQIEYITYGINRKPGIQSNNTVGYSAEFNEQGFVVKLTNLDEFLKPCKDNNGIITWIREYDKRGNITKISYFDDKSNPLLSNENIAGITYTYDDNGNETERTFFGLKGEPCLVSKTFYKGVFTYDEYGNLTSERYYDLDNNLTLNSDGVAGYDYIRDERGNMLENTPIGTNGKLKQGKLIAKRKFDKFDHEIEFAVFDTNGPALNSQNYHRYVCKYNAHNQMTEIAYYGKKGELVCFNDDKYAIQQQEFNTKGHRTRCTYFGTDRKPVLCKEGWHTSTYELDDQGHITRQLFYSLDNKPTDPKVMVPEGVCKYDKWGNMIYIAALDGKGNFIINPNTGWSIRRAEYNVRGKVLKEAYYSEKDKPLISKQQGYHKAMYEYDDKGNEILVTFWNEKEKAMKVEGFHKRTREYDKNGNNTMEAYWDTDNKPISVNGIHKTTALYNEKGQQTETRHYGIKGQAIENSYGYHRFVVTYEADGVTYKTMKYYRLNGSLLLSLRWNGTEWVTQEKNMETSSPSSSTGTGDWKSMLKELQKELPTDLGEDSGYLSIVSAKITSSTSFEIRMKIPYSKYEISEEQMKTYKEYIDLMLRGMMNELKAPSSVKGSIILSDSKNRVIYKTTK